nr:golgin subfamily A member 6-like protein 6 [Macaca nemestrina]
MIVIILSHWNEKKASHQHQDALRRELEAQVHTIRILTCEKTELQTALYYSQRAVQQLEGQSRDLVSRLHDSWKFAGELERALSAVATQKKKADSVSPTTCPIPWEPGFTDGGVSLKVPSAGWSVLPRRQHGHFLLLLCVVVRG